MMGNGKLAEHTKTDGHRAERCRACRSVFTTISLRGSGDNAELFANLGEDLKDPVEMFVFMACHVARAEHLHARRDAGADECVDEHAVIKQVAPELECQT